MKYLLILYVLLLLLSGCSDNEPERKAVTFLIYMAADNSLSEYAMADIDEMERSVFDPAEANVIVQADFSEYFELSGCYRWQIVTDSLYDYEISSPQIGSLGEIDSGNWQSLSSFYNWGVKEYPADRYILSIWSHGNDWYSYPANPNKFCPDNESGSYFDITAGDLRDAFVSFNEHPDLVILDACHMQSAEILTEIYTECNYVCGSPEMIPEYGFPYNAVITEVGAAIGYDYSTIPEHFVNSYKPGGSQNWQGTINQRISASLISTTTLSDILIPRLNYFIEYCSENDVSSDISIARQLCVEFNDLEIDIDLIQFFSLVAQTTSDETLAEICEQLDGNLIAANDFYNYPAANIGNLLITFPDLEDIDNWLNLTELYKELEFDQITAWSQFLENQYNIARNNSLP